MENFIKDVIYGLRLLAKHPAFALTAALSLAFGIGLNTTIFSLINALLLRPLPIEDPARVMAVFTTDPRHQVGPHGSSYPDYVYYRDHNEVFSGLAAHINMPLGLSEGGQTEMLLGEVVSGNYFSVLGVKPVKGGDFPPEVDQSPDAYPLAVISHSLWQRRFNSAADVVGKTVQLNGRRFTVVGVAPPKFRGVILGLPIDVWVPITMVGQLKGGSDSLNDRAEHWLYMLGRLRPGASEAQAQAAMNGLARQLEQAYPDTHKGIDAPVTPKDESRLFPGLQGAATIFLSLVMAVVALVLLIACANVANLLLARAASRRKEIAIRLALGATRGRLIRQLLTESVLLSLLGGAFGVLLAYWALEAIMGFKLPTAVPVAMDLSLDLRVLGFALLASVLTGVVFGLAPALQSSKQDLNSTLKGGPGLSGGVPRKHGLLGILVVVQVTVSLILLIGAGLFLRSLSMAESIDPGFQADNVLVMSVDLKLQNYNEARGREFYRQLLERAAALPGAPSVNLASNLPLGTDSQQLDLYVEGAADSADRNTVGVDFSVVSPGYFRTLGIPLVRGQDFTPLDREGAQAVVIVNEALAQRFWPGQDAVGRHVRFGGPGGSPVRVVGVARNGKYRTLGEAPRAFMYLPFQQNYRPNMTLLVRAAGDPRSLQGPLRREVQALDGNVPVYNLKTMPEYMSMSLLPSRMAATLLGIFGLVALALASTGLYGVISYYVSQRTREIGIRMALGARRGHIIWLVVRRALTLVLIGLVFGLAAAFAAGRGIASALYGVGGTDLYTFVGVPLLMVFVALVAGLVPAYRATKIDPTLSLRYE